MKYLVIATIATILAVSMFGCARNVEDVKIHASKTFEQNGFKVTGYLGYKLDPINGGNVFYSLTKISGNEKITYIGAVEKWGDEYHLKVLRPLDPSQVTLESFR